MNRNSLQKLLYPGILLLLVQICFFSSSYAQQLPGYSVNSAFPEQELWINDSFKDVSILINAPIKFKKKAKTFLVIYALPNGNSIEWTKGKKINPGEDWHFEIQHIAAQTRFVRNLDSHNNYIVVYLANSMKSWPTWRRTTADANILINRIVDTLLSKFKSYNPHIVLNGHSGGGSFIFGFLNANEQVPDVVDRIAFLDSDYGYEDSLHTHKLVNWLNRDKKNTLVVLAYNDSIVIYNGKPLVSPTGGTWYRSRLMQKNLAKSFSFTSSADSSIVVHTALKGRVVFQLKENPAGLIFHTVQVEKNGFIYSLLANTKYDRRKYFTYFGERVYNDQID